MLVIFRFATGSGEFVEEVASCAVFLQVGKIIRYASQRFTCQYSPGFFFADTLLFGKIFGVLADEVNFRRMQLPVVMVGVHARKGGRGVTTASERTTDVAAAERAADGVEDVAPGAAFFPVVVGALVGGKRFAAFGDAFLEGFSGGRVCFPCEFCLFFLLRFDKGIVLGEVAEFFRSKTDRLRRVAAELHGRFACQAQFLVGFARVEGVGKRAVLPRGFLRGGGVDAAFEGGEAVGDVVSAGGLLLAFIADDEVLCADVGAGGAAAVVAVLLEGADRADGVVAAGVESDAEAKGPPFVLISGTGAAAT